MAELKTKKTKASPQAYVKAIKDEQRRKDCEYLLKVMEKITKDKPVMWGKTMVGFGSYDYTYASGRSGTWFVTGFSSRKQALTIYLMCGFSEFEDLMKKLGKYKTGVSCLYVKSLEDIDKKILEKLIKESVKTMKKKYG